MSCCRGTYLEIGTDKVIDGSDGSRLSQSRNKRTDLQHNEHGDLQSNKHTDHSAINVLICRTMNTMIYTTQYNCRMAQSRQKLKHTHYCNRSQAVDACHASLKLCSHVALQKEPLTVRSFIWFVFKLGILDINMMTPFCYSITPAEMFHSQQHQRCAAVKGSLNES